MFLRILLLSIVGRAVSKNCSSGTLQLPQQNQCAIIEQRENKPGDNFEIFNVPYSGAEYFEADTSCRSFGGSLISIHNAFANNFLATYAAAANFTDLLYIGGDNLRNGTWTWIDGTDMNYTKWAPGQMNASGSCMALNVSDSRWYTVDCRRKMSFICEVPEMNTACPDDWILNDGNCYFLHETRHRIKFSDAREICLNEGADLVSIHSEAENDFLMSITHFLPMNNSSYFPWAGLYYNGTFQWTDGSAVTYTKLVNIVPEYYPSSFDLATSGANSGKWEDLSTYHSFGLSCICKRTLNRVSINIGGNH